MFDILHINSVGIVYFLYQILSSIPYIWTFPFILSYFIGIRYYSISSQIESTRIKKKLKGIASIETETTPEGIIFGKWYIACVNGDDIKLITTKKIYESLIEDDMIENKKINKNISRITILSRIGNYNHLWYLKREHSIKILSPRKNQKEIITKIKDYYKLNMFCSVYIHGKPNSGKSSIGLILAQELKASFCNSFNPSEPGDQLSLIYNRSDPTEKKPLVLVIDEIDGILEKVHTNAILPHKNIPISIRDKAGWNLFFDNINLGLYPYLILILTSNKSENYINEMDTSYLRKGRIDFVFNL